MIGSAGRLKTSGGSITWAENSYLPLRRKERAMCKHRSFETLQKFASVHSPVYNYFIRKNHLNRI